MISAKWITTDGLIALKSDEGIHRVPASAVFNAAFNNVRSHGKFSFCSPLEDISGVAFSRFPAGLAVRVFQEGGQLRLEQGFEVSGHFCRSDGDTAEDQVTISGHWFPLHVDLVSETDLWLRSIGWKPNSPLSVGALISLRTEREPPARVFDELADIPNLYSGAAAGVMAEAKGLTAVLYPYQLEGVAYLAAIADQGVGCILGDEMGLGKTLQVIALLVVEKNRGRTGTLIVAPATLLENWRRELTKFAPHLTVRTHAGPERAGLSSQLLGFDVVLVSYDTATRDEEIINKIRWNILGLDEAQNIKTPDAQRTLVTKRIDRRVSIAITGTPVENSLSDLWSLADFALRGMLGTLDEFGSAFDDVSGDATRLGVVVSPILLRRRVLEVAKDLPEKIEIPQALKMPSEMASEYERIRNEILAEYGPAGNLVALTKLRMYCAHPILISSSDEAPLLESPKLARLLEILTEIFSAREKVLVFSTFNGMASLFMERIPAIFPGGFFSAINGSVSVSSRQGIVDEFFKHAGHGALFLNPKAAGVGLNITAANHVIHYNPEWNPAVTDQATARAYRRKQTRPVTVHHLFFASSVEEVMCERVAFKRNLADQAVTGNAGNVHPIEIARALAISPTNER